jgi:hypothetical protein
VDPFQAFAIYVYHNELSRRWFWVAMLSGKTVAEGGHYRTRKAALIRAAGWLLKVGFRPR